MPARVELPEMPLPGSPDGEAAAMLILARDSGAAYDAQGQHHGPANENLPKRIYWGPLLHHGNEAVSMLATTLLLASINDIDPTDIGPWVRWLRLAHRATMEHCLHSDTRWNSVLDALYITGSYAAAQSPTAEEQSPVAEVVARDFALPDLFEWTRPIGSFVSHTDTSEDELSHLLQFQSGRIWQTIAANTIITSAERMLLFLEHSDGVVGLGLNETMTPEMQIVYDAECYAVASGRAEPFDGQAPHNSPPLIEDYLYGLCQAATHRHLAMRVMDAIWQDVQYGGPQASASAATVLAHCWHIDPSEWALATSHDLIRCPMVRDGLLHHPGTSASLRRALLRTDNDADWDRPFLRDWVLQRSFHDGGATASLEVLAREFPAADPLWPHIALHRGITADVWKTMKSRDTLQALCEVEHAVEASIEEWGESVRDAMAETLSDTAERRIQPIPVPLLEALQRETARARREAETHARPTPARERRPRTT